jgi:hypothetical protein
LNFEKSIVPPSRPSTLNLYMEFGLIKSEVEDGIIKEKISREANAKSIFFIFYCKDK